MDKADVRVGACDGGGSGARAALGGLRDPAVWSGLCLACALLWHQFAFQVGRATVVTLPVPFLNHPRADEGWLCALASMVVAALVLALTAGVAASRGRSGGRVPLAWAAPSVAACVTAGGTVIAQVGKQSLALTVAGGLVAGAGFVALAALVVERLSRLVVVGERTFVLRAICVCLVVATVLSVGVGLLGPTPLSALACLLPLMAVACARVAARADGDGAVKGRTRSIVAPSPASDALTRRSHLTALVACTAGIGLLMGFVGFGEDGVALTEGVARQVVACGAGSLVALALFAMTMRSNPDGPYVLLPILLGTAALTFLVPMLSSSTPATVAAWLVRVAGFATDTFAFVLSACLLLETASVSEGTGRTPQAAAVSAPVASGVIASTVSASDPTPSRAQAAPCGPHRLRNVCLVLAACALALLVGILFGGVLVSTIGLGSASVVVVAVSLVYGALVGLGLSVGQRGPQTFVVVSNPQDMNRIAEAQAQALADVLGTLTPREREVLALLLKHEGTDAIAQRLCISRNTVKSHTAHIYEKVGVSSRQQLVDRASRLAVRL